MGQSKIFSFCSISVQSKALTLRCFERYELVRTTSRALCHEDIELDAWSLTYNFPTNRRASQLCRTKHLQRKCSLPITHVSNKGLSADSLPSNRRTFCPRFNLILTVKWSKQKVLTSGNISRDRLALRYWL